MKKELVFLLLVVMVVSSCKKRKKGCIDRLANNYDATAKIESTCYYDGKVVFWMDAATAEANKGKTLDYFLDNKQVLTDSVMQSLTVAPDCGEPKARTFTHNMDQSTSLGVKFKIVDSKSKKTLLDSSVTLRGGYCIPQELRF